MGADQSLIASDGLLARKSGEWAKRKLHFLRNYCGITTVAMRKKWRLRYLDVMAGRTRRLKRGKGREVPGAALAGPGKRLEHLPLLEELTYSGDADDGRIASDSDD